MSSAPADLLLALQHGDSFFPSGAVSFSWGLEGLHRSGELLGPDDVRRFLASQLRYRWATVDRPVLVAAHRKAKDFSAIAKLDKAVEALSLGREFREASARLGSALLTVHEKLGTPGAATYRDAIARRAALGHAPVVQGVVWWGIGLDEDAAAAVSAHALCLTVIGSALRLGLIGHLDGQRCLGAQRALIASILRAPPADIERIGAFTPHTDIGSMRHETQEVRLFAN
jgi:urease accessory protein